MNAAIMKTCYVLGLVLYHKIYIGRSRQFYETVVYCSPNKAGESRLTGSSLALYRKIIWELRVRNPLAIAG